MHLEAFHEIIKRYSPLEQMVRAFFSCADAAAPAKLEVSFGTGVADASFENLPCCTADGGNTRIRSRDGRMEWRQLVLLISYDSRHLRLGAHAWQSGPPGSPADVLGKGAFGKKATDFALVIHREWFGPGTVPVGLPAMETAPAGLERAELEILIYGRSGVPSAWTVRK